MRIGLALSGGGAKAIAQLGVLQALIDNDLEPSVISASSGGAVTALFYASGHSPEAMVELIMDAGTYAYISPNFKRGGLFNMSRARKYYHRFLDDVTFSDLEIPVYIAATDLRSGKTIYFSEGDVVEPLIASTSIPVLYEPVEYLGHLLTDGSVSNNLPYEPLVGKCDKMIGVLTSGFERDFQSQSMRSMVNRIVEITTYNNALEKKDEVDLFIEPPGLAAYGVLSISKAEELFEIGYKYACSLKIEMENFKSL